MLQPALAVSTLIGALDEVLQTLLPGRQAGWDHLAADALGAQAGVGALL
jgi:VanZ family protein